VTVRDSIRIASAGHVAFAATMIGLGIMGFATGDFAQIWQPVPKWVPGRTALVYLCALISLGAGIGLLWRRSAPSASRTLLGVLLVWLLILRFPNLFYQTPLLLVAWSFGSTAVMVAGAWVLFNWFAVDRDRARRTDRSCPDCRGEDHACPGVCLFALKIKAEENYHIPVVPSPQKGWQ